MNKKDTTAFWMEQIEDALEFRLVYGREKEWASLEAMYENLPNSQADKGPNIIQEMAEALESRLNVPNPIIGVDPSEMSPESVDAAPIVQALDNWLMSELEISEVVNMANLHAYLWGRGIIKLGYDSEFGYDEAFDLGERRDLMGMTLTQFDKQGKRIEFGVGRPGMPWVSYVLPHDFVTPWGTSQFLDQAPWVAHRVIRHIDLFRKDPKYEGTSRVEPTLSMQDVVDSYRKPQVRYRTSMSSITKRSSSSHVEFIELWEIRDRRTNEILVVSEKELHRKEIDPLLIEGFPFTSISFIRHPRTFWGTSQSSYLKFHQAEQNDIAWTSSKQRRINLLKFLVQEGAMEKGELERVLSPQVGIAAMVNRGYDPRLAITQAPQGNNYPLYQDAEFSRRNARQAVGFSPNQLGDFDTSSRRTASEAMIVNQGSNQRSDLRQEKVADLYKATFRKLNQIIFTFWRKPHYIQVAPNQWPVFTGQEITGEYRLNVTFGSGRPKNPEARRAEAFQLYMALRQDPLVNANELVKYLSDAFNDVRFGRIFTQPQAGAQNANVQLPVQ